MADLRGVMRVLESTACNIHSVTLWCWCPFHSLQSQCDEFQSYCCISPATKHGICCCSVVLSVAVSERLNTPVQHTGQPCSLHIRCNAQTTMCARVVFPYFFWIDLSTWTI